jgi:hypothetical protein
MSTMRPDINITSFALHAERDANLCITIEDCVSYTSIRRKLPLQSKFVLKKSDLIL